MKVCLTCSHGGHLTEMFRLMDAFKGHDIFFITYESLRTKEINKKYLFRNMGERPILLLIYIPSIFKIMIKERPKIVISTGAEIALPVFFVAKLFQIKTIYIESWCRIYEPSLTGKILYHIADIFLVQWQELLKKYGKKAKFEGAVI